MTLWYFNLCNSIFQMLPTEGSFDLKSKLRLIIERGKRFTHTVNSRSYISPGLIQVCKGFWVDLQTGGGGGGGWLISKGLISGITNCFTHCATQERFLFTHFFRL